MSFDPTGGGPHNYIYSAKRWRWDIDELIKETLAYCARILKTLPDAKVPIKAAKSCAQ